jgi:S-adenosylmethionine decarboxylase proenzyme
MGFKAKEKGYQITAIFRGVKQDKINNFNLIKESAIDSLNKAGFNILGVTEHVFSPQGYTFVVLLAESHFAAHTYPEYNTIYFHLYTCGEKDATLLFSKLKEVLLPTEVVMNKEDVIIKF